MLHRCSLQPVHVQAAAANSRNNLWIQHSRLRTAGWRRKTRNDTAHASPLALCLISFHPFLSESSVYNSVAILSFYYFCPPSSWRDMMRYDISFRLLTTCLLHLQRKINKYFISRLRENRDVHARLHCAIKQIRCMLQRLGDTTAFTHSCSLKRPPVIKESGLNTSSTWVYVQVLVQMQSEQGKPCYAGCNIALRFFFFFKGRRR